MEDGGWRMEEEDGVSKGGAEDEIIDDYGIINPENPIRETISVANNTTCNCNVPSGDVILVADMGIRNPQSPVRDVILVADMGIRNLQSPARDAILVANNAP